MNEWRCICICWQAAWKKRLAESQASGPWSLRLAAHKSQPGPNLPLAFMTKRKKSNEEENDERSFCIFIRLMVRYLMGKGGGFTLTEWKRWCGKKDTKLNRGKRTEEKRSTSVNAIRAQKAAFSSNVAEYGIYEGTWGTE